MERISSEKFMKMAPGEWLTALFALLTFSFLTVPPLSFHLGTENLLVRPSNNDYFHRINIFKESLSRKIRQSRSSVHAANVSFS
jgi:hypothetical protein